MKKTIFSLVLALSVSGCMFYNINSEEVTENYFAPKKSTEEVAYLEEVTEPHEIIGFVNVSTERRNKMQDVIEKMKREAAILGGDAITNITRKTATGEEKLKMAGLKKFFENGYIRATFTVTVVALRKPDVPIEERPVTEKQK
jgi:hypothetical protein